jgi:hypothetical protein
MSATTEDPSTASQRALTEALAEVRARLEARAPGASVRGAPEEMSSAQKTAAEQNEKSSRPASALDTLVARFHLTPFERGIVLLCAGIEFDTGFASLCAAAQNGRTCATFGLALAVLPHAHWSTLAPTGALRRWRLIDVDPSTGLTAAPLRLDERVLHYLAGVSYFDPRLRGIFTRVSTEAELAPAQTAQAQRIVDMLAEAQHTGQAPLVDLQGNDFPARTAVASATCAACDLKLYQVRAADLPAAPDERAALSRLWEREALLGESALLITAEDEAGEPVARAQALAGRTRGVVFFSGPAPLRIPNRAVLALPIDKPAPAEQLALWTRALGAAAESLNGQLARVAAQFSLDVRGVRAAATDFATRAAGLREEKEIPPALWAAARTQARIALDGLAQHLEPAARWEDIVLPPAQLHTLRTIVAQVRQRARVCDAWGFVRKGARGLGLSTLFSGPSGTGKTMAAEVLARELELDLFRIDLSGMVSKYIGETEKNLRRVFDAADHSGAILLFDEADALFGKRSEVRDSHDRYANIEVSYLLQRVEAYRGLAILTTNMKQALDTAFMRRLRFVVPFVFPDAAQRLEIWRRVFPPETPVENLDYAKLARLSLAGGHIRNVALNAAFLAADAGEPVRMRHLLQAAQSEYAKLEKSLSEAEIGGWA